MALASSRLERYAVAVALPASAIGGAAAADIVYTDADLTVANEQTLSIGDATFSFFSGGSYAYLGINLFRMEADGGGVAVLGEEATSSSGRMFQSGDEIGPEAAFFFQASLAATVVAEGDTTYQKAWAAPGGEETRGFLGIHLGTGTDVNYGWIDLGWDGTTARIYGYAYESDANTAILAGATGEAPVVPGAPTAVGLMGLAAGAAGIRRKRSV